MTHNQRHDGPPFEPKVAFLNSGKVETVVQVLEDALQRARAGRFENILVLGSMSPEYQEAYPDDTALYVESESAQTRERTLYMLEAAKRWLFSA